MNNPERPEPTHADLSAFEATVTRKRLEYLRHIRMRGHAVDDAEISRLEAEVCASEATTSPSQTDTLTVSELKDLQEAFAWIDLISEPSDGGHIKLMLIQRDHVKLRMRREDNHSLPHFHLEYKKLYAASYQIDPLRRLAGYMPKEHEKKLSDWIATNRKNLLATWNALKSGEDVRELVVEKDA